MDEIGGAKPISRPLASVRRLRQIGNIGAEIATRELRAANPGARLPRFTIEESADLRLGADAIAALRGRRGCLRVAAGVGIATGDQRLGAVVRVADCLARR